MVQKRILRFVANGLKLYLQVLSTVLLVVLLLYDISSRYL